MTIKVIATSKKPGSRTSDSYCPWLVEDNNPGKTVRQPKQS